MSKFIDKLEQASRSFSLPMGFRAAPTVSRPRMVLVAHLSQADIDSPADYVAGADAGLLDVTSMGPGAKILKGVVKAASDIPWGVWPDSISRGGMEQIGKAGGDFLFFLADKTPLSVMPAEKMGKILVTEALLNDGLIRAINKLPADAVFITSQQPEKCGLTWRHLMLLRYSADLLSRPLLAPVPSDIDGDELQALWDAGVDGVVVGVAAGQPAGRLKEMRRMIDSLTPPSKWKRMQARAIVPSLKEEALPIIEEEEEEEE
jgi:hypothetical protein